MTTEKTEERGNMLVIFREVAEGLSKLDEEDRHKIMDSVLDWYIDGTVEVEGLSPTAALIASMMRDRQLAYAAICRKRSEAGVKSGAARRVLSFVRTKSNSESKSESKSESTSESVNTHGCVRPTLEEVKAYCSERSNHVDAQAWYDHYSSNGWRVGRNVMKDWRAAVRTWERNGIGAAKSATKHSDNYIQATENQIKEFSDGFAR